MSSIGHKNKTNYKRRGKSGGGAQPLKNEKGEGKRHLAKALKKPLKRRKKG